MHPSSLLSYYPTYSLLDEILSYGEYEQLNLYIDLKNCFQTLYQEHAIVNIIENSLSSNYMESSILLSFLSFLSFHKLYAVKRDVNINFYVFFESGQSYYHKNISKKYKISRRIDDLYGLPVDKRDVFHETVSRNYNAIEKICNLIPNIKVIRLKNFEADFIPYYLISRKLTSVSNDTAHLVYSNDHDLMQTLTAGKNIYIFQKVPRCKRIVRCGEVMKRELKRETSLGDEYLPLAMSVIGDGGDDVDGVKGIAGKRFLDISDDLVKLIGNMDLLYNNVMSGEKIFDIKKIQVSNKYLKMVLNEEEQNNTISKNLKLVSFELISRFFDSPTNTEILGRRNELFELMNNNRIAQKDKIVEALRRGNVFIGEEVDILYHGYE